MTALQWLGLLEELGWYPDHSPQAHKHSTSSTKLTCRRTCKNKQLWDELYRQGVAHTYMYMYCTSGPPTTSYSSWSCLRVGGRREASGSVMPPSWELLVHTHTHTHTHELCFGASNGTFWMTKTMAQKWYTGLYILVVVKCRSGVVGACVSIHKVEYSLCQ